MTDITLNTVSSGYNLGKINDNFETVEDVINDDVLHLEGGNNVLRQDIDANGKRLINLPAPLGSGEPLRKGDIVTDATGATVQYVDDSLLVTLQKHTLAEAIALTTAVIGQIVQVTDRADGQFEYVLASGVTTNTFDVVQCNAPISTLALVLRDLESATARQYGATTGDSFGAIQASIDNGYLDLEDLSTEITQGLVLPSGVIVRARGAVIKRQTGAIPPFDMMAGTDLTGLDIEGLITFDGNKDADSLISANAVDRFCGLRLIRCTGTVDKIRADRTVNGEIQVEGIRGGVMFEDCDGLETTNLFGSDTDGSAVFAHTSAMTIRHVRTSNNGGSGFTSFGCDDAEFHDIESKTSGFSGVSVNGANMKCSDLSGEGAANGFANVNIGHDGIGNTADNSVIRGIKSKDSLGWGVTVAGSEHVQIIGLESSNSVDNDVRIFSNSDYVSVSNAMSSGGSESGFLIESGMNNKLSASEVYGHSLSGITVANAGLVIDDACDIHDNGTSATPFTANLTVNSSKVTASGRIRDGGVDNVISNGALAIVELINCRVEGAVGNNLSPLSGGTIQHVKTKLSDDPLVGQFTATAGAITVVPNGNVVDINSITLQPRNSAARAFEWNINAITEGVDFTINFSGSLAGTEVYSYQLN